MSGNRFGCPTTFVNSDFSRMATNNILNFFEFLVVEDSARIAFPLGNETFEALGIKFMNPFGNTYGDAYRLWKLQLWRDLPWATKYKAIRRTRKCRSDVSRLF